MVSSSTSAEEYFDLTYSEEPSSYYYLLLTLTERRADAVWYHSTKNLVTGFASYPFNGSVDELLNAHPFLRSEFKEVIISWEHSNYLVYPKHVIDGSDPAMFRLTNELDLDQEGLLSTELVSAPTSIAFTVPTDLVTQCYASFKHVKIISHIVPRIEAELTEYKSKISQSDVVSVHIWEEQVDVRIYSNGALSLANTFFQSGKEDIAYYVLYACDQIGIDAETAQLTLSGDIKIGDETWELLKKYWTKMKLASPMDQINISSKLQNYPKSLFDHQTYALLCVS